MSAYPRINGVFASQDAVLLSNILRKEWGFDGFVMSDWFAVNDPAAALSAGVNLIMPGGLRPGTTTLPPDQIVLDALRAGTLAEDVVNARIHDFLRVVLKSPVFKGNQPDGAPDLGAAVSQVRAAADEGMVLLKNDGYALPLRRGERIAAFGRNARDFIIEGGGSSEVNVDPRRVVSLLDGLKAAGFSSHTDLDGEPLVEGVSAKTAVAVAKRTDMALISIGRESSEGADRYSMELHPEEVAMIGTVSAAYHAVGKKVVVLLNIGAPIEMVGWNKMVDAILLTWQPGQEAGNAIAAVLSGAVNPSGKLPISFPKRYADSPSYGNFPGYNGTVIYGEGLFVGYRYYDSKSIEPLYPFGYGLSYTQFDYGKVRFGASQFDLDTDKSLTVSVEIKNRGKVAGKEVVQLYLHKAASRLDRPTQTLIGFAKTPLLAPGESTTLSFAIDQRALSIYDPAAKTWVAEPGRYVVRLASSSRDIRGEAKFRAIGHAEQAIGLATPWGNVQTYREAATIVAKYIGDTETNAWTRGNPTLGDKLKAYFDKSVTLKNDPEGQRVIIDNILADLSSL